LKRFHGTVQVGIREKETNKLIAAYPDAIEGEDNDIEDKVMFWYYQQSCSAEERMKNYFVDVLTEKELKAVH